MRSIEFLLLGFPLLLWGCKAPAPQASQTGANAHYVREDVWLGDGKYFYPQEVTDLDQTGLAVVIGADHPPLTTDGEIYDPTALIAAHQTLQLPCIASITNLENGRQINVRVNDRGPADPGRVLALSPRAAALLQIDAQNPAQVRIELLPGPSQQLAAQLHGGGLRLALNTAPVGAVAEQSLAPPPGTRQSNRFGATQQASSSSAAPADNIQTVPDRLPEIITQTVPRPGRIYIRVDSFARADYAMREAAILAPYGHVDHQMHGGDDRFSASGGPYASIAQADAALKLALRLGLRGAHITVE